MGFSRNRGSACANWAYTHLNQYMFSVESLPSRVQNNKYMTVLRITAKDEWGNMKSISNYSIRKNQNNFFERRKNQNIVAIIRISHNESTS